MEAWGDFFIAQVGASAALAGLIFVAVSLNLTKVLALSHLPTRAFQALMVLMEILAISSLALVPQPLPWFGGETILISLPIWITVIVFDMRTLRIAGKEFRRRSVQRMAIMPSRRAALLHRCRRGLGLWARRRLLAGAGDHLLLSHRSARRLGPAGRDQPLDLTRRSMFRTLPRDFGYIE